jgi:ribosomal protein S18 acetylase RimI-like enzyme
MTAAERSHRAVPTNLVIRTATPADVVRLSEIAAAAKAHWGYPPAWLDQWRAALTITPADLSRWTVRVATDPSGAPVGFVATSVAQPRWDVEHLWVDPSAMGQGIGRLLLRDALGRADAAGALGLAIVSDSNAAGFYLRLGGRPAGALPAPMPGAPERTLPLFWLDTTVI